MWQVLPFWVSIPSYKLTGWKIAVLCTFFTFRLVGWLGGRLVWQDKIVCIRWVLPFRDSIPSFNQIGWKMPNLCMFFTFWLVGWLGRLGWSDHKNRIGCKAPYPNTTSHQIWTKSVKAYKSYPFFKICYDNDNDNAECLKWSEIGSSFSMTKPDDKNSNYFVFFFRRVENIPRKVEQKAETT